MNRAALRQKLFQPIDAASLAVFRMLFGTIVLWEVWRYFDHGWIARYYIDKTFLFKYYGFGWVAPWPGDGMYWHFAGLGVAALCVATGTLYRIASVIVLVAFSYVFLLSQARYLNHFYFVILIATVMCFLPAHRYWSVDALLRPRLRSATVPRWAAVPYFTLFYVIRETRSGQMQGVSRRPWPATDKRRNAAGGRLSSRPKGACPRRQCRVAALADGVSHRRRTASCLYVLGRL